MSDILVIRFSSLGDVVMTTGVIEALHRYRPDMRVHMLTKEAYAPLFHDDGRLISCTGITGDESPRDIARKLPVERFEWALDLHSVVRSRAVSAFIKADRTAVVDKRALQRRFMIWTRNRWRRTFDTLGAYLATLSGMGICDRVLPRLSLGEKTVKAAQNRLNEFSAAPDTPVVGIAPGAKHAMKRWHAASFARVADRVQDAGFPVVFIGDRNDIPFIDEVAGFMETPVHSLAGSLSLAETTGIIDLLAALVTNDSGPMHIAGALGTPSVSIFGPTHPDLGFVPGYPQCEVLHTGVQCSPCSIHGEKSCRMPERYCMDGITAPMVSDAISRLTNIHLDVR